MTLVIPARGGSKRIPHKNIKPFLGEPILRYPIRVAQESGVFSRIVVSTDDAEIADVALGAGAQVFWRSAQTASDTASIEDVCREVVGCDDPFACTFPTSVFTTREAWCGAVAYLGDKVGSTCIYSAVEYDTTIYRAMGDTGWVFPEYRDSRTQDCPHAHHDAGQLYVLSHWVPSFLDAAPRMPWWFQRWQCRDIDEPGDWVIAEALYRDMHK